jgi:hypothetical protein
MSKSIRLTVESGIGPLRGKAVRGAGWPPKPLYRGNLGEGWLVVEQDTTPENPTEIARENRVYLEKLLQSETNGWGTKGAP